MSDTHDLLLAAKGGKYVALSRHARGVIEIVGATRGGMDIESSRLVWFPCTKPDPRYGGTLIVNRKQKMERGESEFRGSVNARVRASGMRAKFLIARSNATECSVSRLKREYESTSVRPWSTS